MVSLWEPALHVQFGCGSGTKQRNAKSRFHLKRRGGCAEVLDARTGILCKKPAAGRALHPRFCWQLLPLVSEVRHGQERGAGARAGALAAEEELWPHKCQPETSLTSPPKALLALTQRSGFHKCSWVVCTPQKGHVG